jgi:hypothetical protein
MAEEKKKINPISLIAGAAASVFSALAGSFFGVKGTIIGIALGSVISGTVIVLIENAALRARDKLRRTLKPTDMDSTSLLPAFKVRRSQRPWLLAVAGFAAFLMSALLGLGVVAGVKEITRVPEVGHPVVRVTVTETVSPVSSPVPVPAVPTVTVSVSPVPARKRTVSPPSPSVSPSLSPSPSPSVTLIPVSSPS